MFLRSHNSKDFATASGKELYLKAGIWGSIARGKVHLKENLVNGDTIAIMPNPVLPASKLKFKAVNTIPNSDNLEFKIGNSTEETLFNLKEIVDKSFTQTHRTYNEDLYLASLTPPSSYPLESNFIDNTVKVYLDDVQVGTDPGLQKTVRLYKNDFTARVVYNTANYCYPILCMV